MTRDQRLAFLMLAGWCVALTAPYVWLVVRTDRAATTCPVFTLPPDSTSFHHQRKP